MVLTVWILPHALLVFVFSPTLSPCRNDDEFRVGGCSKPLQLSLWRVCAKLYPLYSADSAVCNTPSTLFPSWEDEGCRVGGVDATDAAIICAVHRVELHRVQPLLPYFLSLYRSQLLFHFAGASSYAMTTIVALGMAGVVCSLAHERTSLSSSCLGSPSGKLHPTTAVTFRVTNRLSCRCVGPRLFVFSAKEDHLVGYITRRGI